MGSGKFCYLDTHKQWHSVTPVKELGRGLTGTVSAISSDKAFKRYFSGFLKDEMRAAMLEKITIMAFHFAELAALKEHPLAWPLGPVFESQKELAELSAQKQIAFDTREFCGFLMPRVHNLYNLEDVGTLDTLGPRRITGRDRVRIARRIAEIMQILHDAGFVVGDINTRNVVVSSDTLLPTFLDCDSFQYRRFSPLSGMIEFASPHVLERVQKNGGKFDGVLRTKEDDGHGLAVLVFGMLMNGRHPYDCSGASPHVNDRKGAIMARDFPYSPLSQSKPPTSEEADHYNTFDRDLKLLFEKVLLRGEPVPAATWVEALNAFATSPGSDRITPTRGKVEAPSRPPPQQQQPDARLQHALQASEWLREAVRQPAVIVVAALIIFALIFIFISSAGR
ncbi:MAG: hypothetical protein ACJ8F3_11655 [Xanthobacteraceae bacterium]